MDQFLDHVTSVLPNPDGPLSARIPSSDIAKMNEEVELLLTESTSKRGGKRGQWKKSIPGTLIAL